MIKYRRIQNLLERVVTLLSNRSLMYVEYPGGEYDMRGA